jgi:multimeric flavodoxin WrbA
VKTLLIAWHSQSGASRALAVAAEAGAAAQVAVQRVRAVDAGAREVAEADALLLVCAENSGRLAGTAKDFLDRIFYPLHEGGVVRPYGLLVSAGNDGRGAVAEAQRIMRGIPFTEATEPLILRGAPDEEALERARELGEGFAAGLSMGIF